MKTLLFLLILINSGCLTSNAQKKKNISYGAGVAISNPHNKIADQLTANRIADLDIFPAMWGFPRTEDYYSTIKRQYPKSPELGAL